MPSEPSDSPPDLSPTDVFELLKHERRRYVLRCLERGSPPLDLETVAERVAAWEDDASSAVDSRQETERVYTDLHHTHLPKLDDAGIVDYDPVRETVAPAGNVQLAMEQLDAAGVVDDDESDLPD